MFPFFFFLATHIFLFYVFFSLTTHIFLFYVFFFTTDIVCPHIYFRRQSKPPGYLEADPIPAIIGATAFFLWCFLPFILINVALLKAVKNAEEGGQNLDDLQLTDRSFRLKFGWAVNKYRTYPHPWETGILGDNNDHFMFFAACIWETFNAIVKISAVAAAELMFAKTRVSFMKTGKLEELICVSYFFH